MYTRSWAKRPYVAHYRIMEAGSVYPYGVRKIRINTDVSILVGGTVSVCLSISIQICNFT